MKHRSDERLVRDVGRRIAELREHAGLTQQEFAERLEVAPQYLRRLESGSVNMSLGALNRVAKALKAPLLAFFEVPSSRARRRPGRPPSRSPEA